jgi:hypothetical protein
MVNAHPELAIIHESPWIIRLFDEPKGQMPKGLVTAQLIARLLKDRKFIRLEVGRDKLEELLGTTQPVSYRDFVTRIFDLYGQSEGKSLVGDKTPGNVRKLHTLHALWPTARFVHLIRDGRDVCLSLADWPRAHQMRPGIFATWKDDSVSTSALWWESNVRLGREAGNSLGPELYYEIRYESLIANPEEECAALCAFLGLSYDGAMLQFHEGRTMTDPALDAKRAWRPVTPGLRNWKTQMSAEDLERFEAAAGELLGELGYPRAVSRPRPEALGQASKVRDSLAQDPNWSKIVLRSWAEILERAERMRDARVEDQGSRGSLEGRA